MHRLREHTERRLRRLAKLRAEGHTWGTIAERTGWTEKACESLTARHRRTWRLLLFSALKMRILEAQAEGLAVLRVALRHPDIRVRRLAATAIILFIRLLGLGRGGAPKDPTIPNIPDDDRGQFVKSLKSMTHEELYDLFQQWDEREKQEQEMLPCPAGEGRKETAAEVDEPAPTAERSRG